jgi:photosystem I P700 chlorophyll a apoprotein A1
LLRSEAPGRARVPVLRSRAREGFGLAWLGIPNQRPRPFHMHWLGLPTGYHTNTELKNRPYTYIARSMHNMVFSDFSRLWSKGGGHFSVALVKGAKTTSLIWNLHADAHDFDIPLGAHKSTQPYRRQLSFVNSARKIFSSGLAHLSLVFLYLSQMHFHGAYFSNNSVWNKDPLHCLPSAHLVWSIIGQDILNSDVGGYFQGIYITSAIFGLWRSTGIITHIHLKYASTTLLSGTIICIVGSYFHVHIGWSFSPSLYQRPLPAHLSLLLGLASISWCGHQIHISLPINRLLISGVDPAVIPWPQDLLTDVYNLVLPPTQYKQIPTPPLSLRNTDSSTGSIALGILAAHHFYLGIAFIASGLISRLSALSQAKAVPYVTPPRGSLGLANSSHAHLSFNLLLTGSSSIIFAFLSSNTSIPVYPYQAIDYPTSTAVFCHHVNIGSFLIVGAFAHASIYMIRDLTNSHTTKGPRSLIVGIHKNPVLNHRCLVIGHLIYLSIALGFHSFGLYIHNDTLQSLGRAEDMFGDNSIQLKPPQLPLHALCYHAFDIEVLDGKVLRMASELGTADFMLHHIHAFTIHVTLLVLLKGILYARGSRLNSDKLELGWRYPCDGPGRGGTCQISPYDHLYLALFWSYNSLSVILFHYFWKMQSDVWASLSYGPISNSPDSIATTQVIRHHISGSDFSVNSGTISGWLRNFLWSQAAQVIQSYATSVSAYGLIFLCAHFVWAFSLMFLYSGRGYWQELIESYLWSHQKLKIVNVIQPRALSITQARAVGLTHYILGGIGCTWFWIC